MNAWKYSRILCKELEASCLDENNYPCYPRLCGALEANISNIFMHLKIYHPDAFSHILKVYELNKKEAL